MTLPTYQIVHDGTAIRCLICGKVSYNSTDVREKYCGNCHQFHDLLGFERPGKRKERIDKAGKEK